MAMTTMAERSRLSRRRSGHDDPAAVVVVLASLMEVTATMTTMTMMTASSAVRDGTSETLIAMAAGVALDGPTPTARTPHLQLSRGVGHIVVVVTAGVNGEAVGEMGTDAEGEVRDPTTAALRTAIAVLCVMIAGLATPAPVLILTSCRQRSWPPTMLSLVPLFVRQLGKALWTHKRSVAVGAAEAARLSA